MGKPHPLELRQRVVAFVDEGNTHREAARHFRTSPKCVNDMIKLRRETGGLDPKPQGNQGGCGKLSDLDTSIFSCFQVALRPAAGWPVEFRRDWCVCEGFRRV
ncbi:MAG: hypothetical protein V3R90_13485 [Limibaculum sp.]